jgi:hypothetical protein
LTSLSLFEKILLGKGTSACGKKELACGEKELASAKLKNATEVCALYYIFVF